MFLETCAYISIYSNITPTTPVRNKYNPNQLSITFINKHETLFVVKQVQF